MILGSDARGRVEAATSMSSGLPPAHLLEDGASTLIVRWELPIAVGARCQVRETSSTTRMVRATITLGSWVKAEPNTRLS